MIGDFLFMLFLSFYFFIAGDCAGYLRRHAAADGRKSRMDFIYSVMIGILWPVGGAVATAIDWMEAKK